MENSKRKNEIIDIALRVFLEKGFNNASLNDIAKAAGIKAPTLFGHFENKEELHRLVVEKYLLNVQNPKQKLASDTFPMRLIDFIDFYLLRADSFMSEAKKMLQATHKTSLHYFQFILDAFERYDDYAASALQINKEEIALWEEVISYARTTGEVRADVDSFEAARTFRYTYVGLGYVSTASGGLNMEQAREAMLGVYNAIKNRE